MVDDDMDNIVAVVGRVVLVVEINFEYLLRHESSWGHDHVLIMRVFLSMTAARQDVVTYLASKLSPNISGT